jgi:hypothetical protein
MKIKKTSVFIALIHNNNLSRNSYIQPQLENLTREMQSQFSVSKFEVSYQEEIIPHNTSMACMRDVIYQNLSSKWRKYRLLKSGELRNWVNFLRATFVKFILNHNEAASRWKRTSAIEMMLTDKHVRAWTYFVDSGADYLIIFEDDAVFKDDSAERIRGLLNKLSRNHLNKSSYVDLGGGCKLEDLMIDRLQTHQDENYRYYKKSVTNTACAYLISRELATSFCTTLTRKPWLRLVGVDWLMNSLFIIRDEQGLNCICMHSDPTIVKHGTCTGDYSSSIR